MIKRTLLFSNPAYLSTQKEQIIFEHAVTKEIKTIPIEDVGIVLLEHKQITITTSLMAKLIDHNVALISCDDNYMPNGLFMPLNTHTTQKARMDAQVNASIPLKKQLWQQTVKAKIINQANHLGMYQVNIDNMKQWANAVKSGDPENYEARAAAYYWKCLLGGETKFNRERYGDPPNNFLNYGYSILRSLVARQISGSGLLPIFGIHHKNQYNAYCLADDLMEPYRPFVDKLVKEILEEIKEDEAMTMTTTQKQKLLTIPTLEVIINNKRSPLMVALQSTTSSLAQCFEKKVTKISYPELD